MTILRDSLIARVHFVDARAEPSWDGAVAPPSAPLTACQARDALTSLYADHSHAIHRFLSGLLGDAVLAADATQETFVRAFRRIDTLCDRARTVPWLFGIARNVSLEMRKARRRVQRVMVPCGEHGEHGDHQQREAGALAPRSPESELLAREALGVVNAALVQLSEDRRAVLMLRLDHGLAYDEIAELMGWSLSKTKVEVFRAREVLRATMTEYREGVAR